MISVLSITNYDELHAQSRSATILCILNKTTKMSKQKKGSKTEKPLTYYSEYKYCETMESFVKSDRLMEGELVNLECYSEFQVERSLNSMDDKVLNDHLYKIFYSKKPDTTALMRRWIGYYVRQHKLQIDLKVKEYLE